MCPPARQPAIDSAGRYPLSAGRRKVRGGASRAWRGPDRGIVEVAGGRVRQPLRAHPSQLPGGAPRTGGAAAWQRRPGAGGAAAWQAAAGSEPALRGDAEAGIAASVRFRAACGRDCFDININSNSNSNSNSGLSALCCCVLGEAGWAGGTRRKPIHGGSMAPSMAPTVPPAHPASPSRISR
ncbi:hypothetical protein BN1263520098 [Stenotrophomonas indicatrix]|nr:hypothetical protein BN1263520098 [Stenotrophomonas indicatrix]